MFTFSFGSTIAYGATTDAEKAAKLADAKAVAEKIVTDNYDAAMKLVLEDNLGYTEADANDIAAAWAKIDAKADVLAAINEKYVAESKTLTNYDEDANKYAAKVFTFSYGKSTTEGALSYTDSTGLTYKNVVEQLKIAILGVDGLQAVYNMYEADRADAFSAYDKVDWSVYSTEVNKTDADKRTYLEIAQDIIEDAKEEAKTFKTWAITAYTWESPLGLVSVLNQVKSKVASVVTEQTVTVAGANYKTGLYTVNGVATKNTVETSDAADNAKIAAYKAAAASAYAQFIQNRGTTYKTFADAWLTVVNYLAEEGMLTSTPTYDSATNGTLLNGAGQAIDPANTTYAAAVDQIKGLETLAAKYKAEKDATGALVRNAEDIDDIVAEYTAYLYGTTHRVAIASCNTYTTLSDAETAITGATISSDAQKLEFAKEVAKAKLADALEALKLEDNYYKLEQDVIQKNYEAGLAKIEAAATPAKVESAYRAVKLIKDAKDMTSVDALCTFSAGTPEKNAFDAVEAYVTYANSGKTILNDDYIVATDDNIKAEIKALYGENGARTSAERKAVTVDAATIAAKLSTVGKLAAAKTAAEDAIKALPTTITVNDKDAVVAAYNLADDYKDMYGAGTLSNQSKLDAAVTSLASALKLDLSKRIAAVDKTDKAALIALSDEIEATNDLLTENLSLAASYKVDTTVVDNALDKVRDTELAAVIAKINALPVNITEADKAAVEAARAAYNAFVKDWTEYNEFGDDNYNAAAKVTNFRTLALAEAALGLNDNSDENAKAYVQDLKIKARSVKTSKGVKVTINADVQSLLDNGFTVTYKFYRSTKSNAKFGTAKVTKAENTYLNTSGKKGTKYYYKAKLVVKNAKGEVVATTPLTQCLYASRTF